MNDVRYHGRTVSRRALIASLGAGVPLTAGCLAGPDNDTEETDLSGSAAFYTLMHWGETVGGDVLSFETPVETGEMGHGWDPDVDIVPNIAQNDVFFYLETPEFQWAIDVASELTDEDHDINLIDGMEAISTAEMLPFTDTHGDHSVPAADDGELDPATTEIAEFEILVGNEVAAWWHDDHWHGGIPDVPVGETRTLSFIVKDVEGTVLPLAQDDTFEVVTRVADGAPDDVLDIENHGDRAELPGVETGQTLLVFEILVDDDPRWDTTNDPATVTVAEADDIETDAFYDPHVWVDPIHAASMVDYLAVELGELVPEEADRFEENATAYQERIAAVDEQFEALVADAELDVGVLVAHDAFQYLENRYGFELRTPVGVTPDAAESIQDVAGLVETIDEYNIETILFDPFEAPNPDEDIPQAATLLLEETDASDAAPLTAVEGVTPTWLEEGYGWVEQMEEINLPSLRRALRAE